MSAGTWVGTSVPSERDWEVHRLVTVEGITTRETAKMLEISQTRVVQIVRQVNAALRQFSPTEKDPGRRHQQLYLAEALAGERLGRLYRWALDCFEVSQEDSNPKRTSRGDVRYLNVALRIAVQLAKLPANDLLLDARVAAGEFEEAQRQQARAANVPAATAACPSVTPTKVDCSAPRSEQVVTAMAAGDDGDAKSLLADLYEENLSVEEFTKLLGAETVQTLSGGLFAEEEGALEQAVGGQRQGGERAALPKGTASPAAPAREGTQEG